MRGLLGVLVVAGMTGAACERVDRTEAEVVEPELTLRVETPEALDWGATGRLRLTLANEGEAPSEGGIVEVHVPDWLEFGQVDPPGVEVTVLSGEAETRLSYQLTDTIPAGGSVVVEQQLRVRDRPVSQAPVADSVPTVQLPPSNLIVRARLLTPAGEPIGAEVQASLHFVGYSGPLTVPRDTVRDTLAQPRDTARPRTPSRDSAANRTPPRDTTTRRTP